MARYLPCQMHHDVLFPCFIKKIKCLLLELDKGRGFYLVYCAQLSEFQYLCLPLAGLAVMLKVHKKFIQKQLIGHIFITIIAIVRIFVIMFVCFLLVCLF